MLAAVTRLPLLALVLVGLALGMLLPLALAMLQADWSTGRAFFYSAAFTAVVATGIALILPSHIVTPKEELGALALAWLIVPVFAALPLYMETPRLGLTGVWFEMTTSFTTTGGSAYRDLTRVPDAIHLWRGLVAWLGGFFTLTAAYAIFAPRRMGGFEIDAAVSRALGGMAERSLSQSSLIPPLNQRLFRAIGDVAPIYCLLTAVLGLIFHAFGQDDLDSAVHAMSILSTSGISPRPEGLAGANSLIAELSAFVLMVLAATRLLYGHATHGVTRHVWYRDVELRLMAWLVGLATLLLFGRHWIGALTVITPDEEGDLLAALWGNIFTVTSFLTTTGFVSASWEEARHWSGLSNPSLVLLGLAAVGGGAATTAGGVKLIRAYALFRHGFRELERIAKPDSIIGVGVGMRGMMRQGAVIAWTFIMLYFIVLTAAMLGLTAAGMSFQNALISATAALSNTGPVYEEVTSAHATFAELNPAARIILGIAMIAGRIEMLALAALLNQRWWSNTGNATRNLW